MVTEKLRVSTLADQWKRWQQFNWTKN